LRVIAQSLSANCPGAADVSKAALHIGAIAFIRRFGSSLNGHVHFHVCAVDGVFKQVPGIVFHPASAIDEAAVAQVQADLRRRVLRAFVGRGLLERLQRYCARPPFAMERLRKEGAELVYRCAKQHSEPGSDKRGAKADELHLTPLELIDRIAALVPPPRTHRPSKSSFRPTQPQRARARVE
jgi:hypothetical protein